MTTRRQFSIAFAAALAAAPALAQNANHPAEDYKRAANLFRAGRQDDAVYWFFHGQYRYRAHLIARPALPRDGDPALFASLSQSIGKPINEYAFGDIPRLLQTLDRVIAEAQSQDDAFTPKSEFAAAHQRTLAGLISMRDEIDRTRDQIRAQRTKNGLPNRV